jgi:hypothetical protein
MKLREMTMERALMTKGKIMGTELNDGKDLQASH